MKKQLKDMTINELIDLCANTANCSDCPIEGNPICSCDCCCPGNWKIEEEYQLVGQLRI